MEEDDRYFNTEKWKAWAFRASWKGVLGKHLSSFDRSQLEDFASQNNVPIDFLTDSLDTDERSRYESEEEIDLVVVNTPVRNEAFVKDEALYITIPIGIISTPDFIITISSFKNPVIDDFLHGRIKMLKIEDQQWFTLRLLDRNVHYFQYYLKEINTKRYTFESEIYRSSEIGISKTSYIFRRALFIL